MSVFLSAALSLTASETMIFAQDAPGKAALAPETKGMLPRATAADYQAHAAVGDFSIGAEFAGHTVPVPQATLVTDSYVMVEVGMFGAPDAHATISAKDFSLHINDKKGALPAQPYAMIFDSLNDPEWEPPIPVESKSKTSIGSAGGGGGRGGDSDDAASARCKPPFPVISRVVQQK